MLFKISKTDSNDRDVFPNVLRWGTWVIAYDNQSKPTIEGSKFILGKFDLNFLEFAFLIKSDI